MKNKNQPDSNTIGNGLKITKTNTVNSKLISNSSDPYINRINRKRPAPDIDTLIQNDIYFEDEETKDSSSHLHDVPSMRQPHKRHASEQDVNPHEEVFNNNVNINSNHNNTQASMTSNLSDSECNRNLPSPSMSPNLDSKIEHSSHSHSNIQDDENKDDYLELVKSSSSPFRDITDQNREIPLSNIPYIISTFDVLPSTMKSYILLHLLRRCRVPTLQYISSLILTSLKYDFFSLLPIDISYRIIEYLDFRSIAICSQVSKSWYKLFNSPRVDMAIWKYQLKNDFWIDKKEIRDAIILWNKNKNKNKNKVPISSLNDSIASTSTENINHVTSSMKEDSDNLSLSYGNYNFFSINVFIYYILYCLTYYYYCKQIYVSSYNKINKLR